MKALSIWEPWAYLIAHGFKTIENRTWPTSFRGRIYIHAGKQEDIGAWRKLSRLPIWKYLSTDGIVVVESWRRSLPRGFILGEVDIEDCITRSDNPWFEGPYGFVLRNPMPYEKPIPYRGRQGFFEVKL